MEVRANSGKGSLLFEWRPEIQTVNLIRKNMYYEVQLDEHSYCVREECSKYECKNKKSHN